MYLLKTYGEYKFSRKLYKMLIITKLLCIFMFAGIFTVTASEAYSQTSKISVKLRNVSIETALSEIEKLSEFSFFYTDEVELKGNVNLNAKEQNIDAVLRDLFEGTDLTYKIRDKQIIIHTKENSLLVQSQNPQAQGIRIIGTVSDGTSGPIPGVNVVLKGTAQGTATDVNGEFTFVVPNDTCTLEFRFVGYKTQEIKVGNRRVIAVVMEEETAEIGEVVVVAFAKQKKESVLASITTVNPDDLKVPSSNLSTALAGRIAGLVSYQTSGEPGMDDASFFVRGVTSLNYGAPLVLIDGVEMSTTDLARMQPDDIGSFSIMKDAAATALYGARGANGVILITTKEGREGQASISFRVETSLSTPTKTVDIADPVTYMRLNNEAVSTRNKMTAVPYSLEKIENTVNPNRNKYMYPANDWYEMLFNDYAINYRANFNVSGGGKIARYYIAATYNKDNGVLKVDKKNNFNSNIDLKRYLLRANVNINVTKTTEAIVRLQGTFDDYRGPMYGGSDVYHRVMRSDPVLFPATYAPDATYAYVHHILFGNYDQAQYINPYADLVRGYKDYSKSKMFAQFEVKQNLDFVTPGLSLRGLFNTDRYSYYSVLRAYQPYYYTIASYDKYSDTYQLACLNQDDGQEWLSYGEEPKEVTTSTYIEASALYDRTFGNHAVSGMLVFTMRNYLEANAGSLELSLPQRNLGLSGRATYAFANRYFMEFNFGYNGSERFARAERFGFFPSFGVGWIVSNESFWNDNLSNVVSKLKLKGTYGLVGNDAIGDKSDRFFYLSNVNMNDSGRGYTFGTDFGYTRTGISVSRYGNDLITWETAKKMNLGVELGLFNKLELIVDYYTEKREGILLTRSDIPYTAGLQNAVPKANLGKAKGSGIDISLDYQHSFSSDFWITSRANFTYATTEITEWEEVDNTLTPWLSRIGQPVSQQRGYVAERLFVDDYEVRNSPRQYIGSDEYAGGDIKYRDIDGDGQITSTDKVPIGYPTEPQVVYGFGASLGYKGWDFSFFFQGLAQRSFWINTASNDSDNPSTVPFIDPYTSSSTTSKNALLQAYADSHWSEDNKDIYALWPRFSDKMIANNFADKSTWFMRDGSFMRLKSIELGYTIPPRALERIKIKNLRLYFSGTNLFTVSKFKLWDPEMAGNGLGYPLQRVYNLGVQVTF